MSIVKWLVSAYATAPERKEYDKETECFYICTSGRMKAARRDAKSSIYHRYFDSEAEAIEFIRQRAENKAEQKRVDQIKRHAVELLEALEGVIAVADRDTDEFIFARAVVAKAKGVEQ